MFLCRFDMLWWQCLDGWLLRNLVRKYQVRETSYPERGNKKGVFWGKWWVKRRRNLWWPKENIGETSEDSNKVGCEGWWQLKILVATQSPKFHGQTSYKVTPSPISWLPNLIIKYDFLEWVIAVNWLMWMIS